MNFISRLLEYGGMKKDVVLLAASGIALLLSLFAPSVLPFDPAWIAIILCGIPILLECAIGLITEFDIKADLLVSLALIASVITGEDFAAGEIAFIMQIGALLEDYTVAKARAGIEKLARLSPVEGRVIRDGREQTVPVERILKDDVLRVLPGETIPVDGVILSGATSINQAVMTGESIPVDKNPGDEVSSGTVNLFGAFDMRATRVGADSSLQRMIRLVQSADAGKAKIVRLADRWATWVVVTALASAAVTWAVTGEVIRAVTILVVFCPCSLVLATPTAVMAAIGNASKRGFLVREGDALERLATVTAVAFDKTGTLTCGKPETVATVSITEAFTPEQVSRLTAVAELRSEHPLGKAVTACRRRDFPGEELPAPENFAMVPGRGVTAVVEGHSVMAGSHAMLEENGIHATREQLARADEFLGRGCTVIWTAIDGIAAGLTALSDTLRPDACAMIRELKNAGAMPTLLTGDNEHAAAAVAERLGITDFKAACLPEDKLNWIDGMQRSGHPVCMVGDGINDAPAIRKARVGIAMGDTGSDITMDAADITQINSDIIHLPHLIRLSRRMMRVIKFNLTFAMGLNFTAIILAALGILNPVMGALVHNCGSVAVIINSAFLLNWGKK